MKISKTDIQFIDECLKNESFCYSYLGYSINATIVAFNIESIKIFPKKEEIVFSPEAEAKTKSKLRQAKRKLILTKEFNLQELVLIPLYNPYDYGRTAWDLIKPDLRTFLCSNGTPKEWVNNCIKGEIRNLAIALIPVICAAYKITIGICIPIVALIIIKGINNLCRLETQI